MAGETKKYNMSTIFMQTRVLFLSEIFASVSGFISSMILSHKMGSLGYGIFSFALSVIGFAAIFFEFGFFASGARLLAINQEREKEKRIIGTLIFILLLISIAFIAVIIILSFIIDFFYKDKIGNIIRIVSLLSPAFIIPFFMQLILGGNNSIRYLSFFKALSKVLYLSLVIVLYILDLLTPSNVLLLFCLAVLIPFAAFSIKLGPVFSDIKEYSAMIINENKRYGMNVYFGRIVDVATYNLDKVIIPYFVGAKEIGFYNLAFSMANPINLFSTSLSSSSFKKFSDGTKIQKEVIRTNLIWILFGVGASIAGGYIIVYYYLGSEYYKIFKLLPILALAVAFQGAYQPYNSWLSSNGYGQRKRNMAFKMTLVNVISNLVLIPLLGSSGGAIASMISMVYAYILHYFNYKEACYDENLKDRVIS